MSREIIGNRPNILLIIAHDLGTHLGCYGASGVVSPRLDQLAAQGVRFNNHYCSAAFCSPSRGAIFTGKYPHVNGLMGLINLGWDMPEENVFLGEVLNRAGYETLLFGLEHEIKDPKRLYKTFDKISDRSINPTCENIAPMVCDFLGERDRSKPFYARVGFSEVHRVYDQYTPSDLDEVFVPPYLADTLGAREDLAMFQGAIQCMDTAVGKIMDALEASGEADHTVVIFTTDHGIAFPRAKATLYDAGLKTSLLMRWPQKIEPGLVCDALMSSVDLFPTVLDMVDTSIPEDIQGRSFWPVLQNPDYVPREWIFAEKNTSPDDIKRGIRTARYKYIRNYDDGPLLKLPTDIEGSLTRRDMGQAHLAARPMVELYDLKEDPLEQNNLHKQAEMAQIENELATLLGQIMEETHDPILQGSIARPDGEDAMIQKSLDRVLKKVAERDGVL